MTKYLFTFTIISILLLALSACKKAPEKVLIQPEKPATETPRAILPPENIVKEKETAAPVYHYASQSRPDPFEAYDFAKAEAKGEIITPLQQFDVTQFRLVGIISGISDGRALVEDPTGKGYTLQVGMLIGKNNGKVVRILNDEVLILEKYEDFFGRVKTNEISLKLAKPEGEGQ